MTITELSIKRPTLIVVIFAALALLGVYSYTQLNYELLPKITPPVITIVTVYPGASPSEVESSVTKKIEDAISTLDEVDNVTSTSSEGISFVVIQFLQSAEVDVQLQNAQRKVNEIVATLPNDVKTPTLSKFALDELPVIRMGATSNLSSTDFYQFIKDRIQPRLAKLPGVGQITLVGGEEREIKVNLNKNKIEAYGLSILQIAQVIKASNLDYPTGKIKNERNQFIVRIAGKFNSIDDLRNLTVGKSRNGGDIRLSDVADVEDGHKDYTTINRINGVTSIGIIVQKQTDANSVDVSKLVRNELAKMESDFKSQHVKFNIAQDGSQFTIDAANGVKFDLGLAVVLVAIVMLLFLHSFRNSFIVMLAIPASMVSSLIMMLAFGFTLNLMTLLGLSLIVGILVDDSIVVLENIHHHLEKGEGRREAALKGRNEIGFAALAITMVDVSVFVPLALTGGLVGNIVREYAIVVVTATLMSLFVSFTLTPLLASRISKIEKLTKRTLIGRFSIWFENGFRNFAKNYDKLLKWSLVHRWAVIMVVLIMFFASLSLAPLGFIGAEFMTQTDRGEFAVILEMPSGSSIENTNIMTREIEDYIYTIPEVKKSFVAVGASNEGLVGQTSNYSSEIDVALVPKDERKKSTDQIGEEIKRFVNTVPGVKIRVNPIGIFGTANQTPIQLVVSGSNRADVEKGAMNLVNVVNKIPGTADVRVSSEEGKPETRINIDRAKLANFGLNIAEVGSALRVALTGDDDSKFRDGDNDYSILIALDDFDKSAISDINHLTFKNPKEQLIELQQFADIYQTIGPTKLQRRNRISAVTVFSQVIGRATGSIGADIKKEVDKGILPSGVEVQYEGDLKNQADSFGSLGLALIAAIIFVYMVMVALYDSFIYPFVVLFSIPVAMVGAFLALALTMKSLNLFSILGIIMLVGLVGKNAILLVDRTNQTRKEKGLSVFDALIEAGQSRIRPIVMTTTAMVFGMLPLAISTDSGSEWKAGLAWAIIGGLISSMFLSLVLVPVMYEIVDKWKTKVSSLILKRKHSDEVIEEVSDLVGLKVK